MCWSANFDGSLADAKILAKAAIDAKRFPLADRFEILDREGRRLYEWPEKNNAPRHEGEKRPGPGAEPGSAGRPAPSNAA